MQQDYTVEYLEDILSKCRKTSHAIQIKYQNCLNYDIAASIILFVTPQIGLIPPAI